MFYIKCGNSKHKSNVYTRLAIINWEQVYLKRIVFVISSQVGYILAEFQENRRQRNVLLQLDIDLSQEKDFVDCHGALPVTSNTKSVTYIFIPKKQTKK